MDNKGFFETPIEFLKGIGPQRGDLLKKEMNIFSLYFEFNDRLDKRHGHFYFCIPRCKQYLLGDVFL